MPISKPFCISASYNTPWPQGPFAHAFPLHSTRTLVVQSSCQPNSSGSKNEASAGLPLGQVRSSHMTTVQDILDAARALPSGDRAQIIAALWDSVSADDWTPPSDAWTAEIQRRSNAYENEQMTASPWSDARQRARREAGLDG